MLELERKGDEVYCNGRKLTIVAQATKGPGKEVVKIEGLEGSNGQKWISLSKLTEGLNEIECNAREVTTRNYTLTEDEKAQIAEYQAKIDEIVENAKKRYVKPINLNKIDPSKLSDEERLATIEMLQKYVAELKK